jgi:hypothetical protein
MTEEEKNIKRIECKRLMDCKTLEDCRDFLGIYCEYFCCVTRYETTIGEKEISRHEAKLVNQMIFTKALTLKKMLEGINFQSKTGIVLNSIIDPTIVAMLIRNLYETVFMFNHIYVQPKTDSERLISYKLWVYSGLSYRQRFEKYAITEDAQIKCKEEKKEMDSLQKEIQDYYKLPENDKTIFKILRKDCKIKFDNGRINSLSWKTIAINAGLRDDFFDEIYNYLSLYAHPSNVSVFQFNDLFKSCEMVVHNLKYAFMFLSVFIADYIKVFPDILKLFEALPIEWQIAINFKNTLAREEQMSINDSFNKLAPNE